MKQRIGLIMLIVAALFIIVLLSGCVASIAPIAETTPTPYPTQTPQPPPQPIIIQPATNDDSLLVGVISFVLGMGTGMVICIILFALVYKPNEKAKPPTSTINVIVGSTMYTGSNTTELFKALMNDGFSYYQARQILDSRETKLLK